VICEAKGCSNRQPFLFPYLIKTSHRSKSIIEAL
jgi:hypothetical protein